MGPEAIVHSHIWDHIPEVQGFIHTTAKWPISCVKSKWEQEKPRLGGGFIAVDPFINATGLEEGKRCSQHGWLASTSFPFKDAGAEEGFITADPFTNPTVGSE